VSKEYEDEVKEIYEALQATMEARLKFKKAAEKYDLKKREAAIAKNEMEMAQADFEALAEDVAKRVKKHPEAETLDVLAKRVNDAQLSFKEMRKGASHVGSSVQGQCGFHTDNASEPEGAPAPD
jgi:predicted anti-sigma-YlaC factor YlaD